MSFAEALGLVDEQRERLRQIVARDAGALPAEPDLARVDEWSVGAHLRFWRAGVVEGRRGPVAA